MNDNINENGLVPDLNSFFKFLLENLKFISFVTFLFAIISIIYSLSIKNIYQSYVVLAPTNQSLNNLSQYKGVASLAGFSIPNSSEENKVEMALEELVSLNFFEELIFTNDLFFGLVASSGWDEEKNIFIINNKIYDSNKLIWVSKNKYAVNGKPSIQHAHKKFLNNLSIDHNTKSGFVKISFEHYSPYYAKKIIDTITSKINENSKDRDINVAKKSILYLEDEAKKTKLNDVRVGISALIQRNIETIAIANSSPEYLLTTISHPYVSESKYKPRRSLIVIFITLFGFILSIFLSLIFSRLTHFKNGK
jgi:uncharacterized protein involved in exopolysaccharide biosynthesis